MEGANRPLREDAGVRDGAGVEKRGFMLIKDDEIDGNIADGLSQVINHNPSKLGSVLRVKAGISAFDNDAVRELLERIDFRKLIQSHSISINFNFLFF